MGALKPAHGGDLKNLYLSAEDAAEEKTRSKDLKSWDLTPRQLAAEFFLRDRLRLMRIADDVYVATLSTHGDQQALELHNLRMRRDT